MDYIQSIQFIILYSLKQESLTKTLLYNTTF